MRNVTIRINGELQNVGFTFQIMMAADQFNINGSATYLSTKTVKIEAEGTEKNISKFIDWIKHDSMGAKIADISIEPNIVRGFRDFTIASLPPSNSESINRKIQHRSPERE